METAAIRKIIHVDMDAFYASVEVRDDPSLRGQPVVVGGSPSGRGVVAAASYEARKFGIHSAMPASRALRLCPQAVFLRPDFQKYRAVSGRIQEIFHRYSDLVEPLSLDEAYLDVTNHLVEHPSATWVAQQIKGAILAETALTASAGVSVNKFLAKIASEEKKPDGLFVIRPHEVGRFLQNLPLGKVPGVGAVTLRRFEQLGVLTCGQLLTIPLEELTHHFGKRGEYFYRLARGEDDRPVEPYRERKSISIEDTFAEDHGEEDWLGAKLAELVEGLEARAAKAGLKGRTVTLKLRLTDFTIHTRSLTLPTYTRDPRALLPVVTRLYRESGLAGQKLRLLGVGLSHLDNQPETARQPRSPARDFGQLELPLAGDG